MIKILSLAASMALGLAFMPAGASELAGRSGAETLSNGSPMRMQTDTNPANEIVARFRRCVARDSQGRCTRWETPTTGGIRG